MGGETVGLIGLGNLGRPVARRLLGCGYELVVYDRDPSRTAGVVDLGAAGTTDPRELGGRVDVALTALPNRAAIEDAVLHDEHGLLAGLHPGSTLIDFSTNSLDLTRRLGDRCDEAGIHVLDAAMTQARGSVADGRAVIMVGGEPGVLERWRPLLARLSNNISAMGPHGSGTVTKLVTQYIGLANIVTAIEGLLIAAGAGIELGRVFDVLPSTYAESFATVMVRQLVATHPFETPQSADGTLALLLKDIDQALALSRELGTSQRMGNGLRDAFTSAQSASPDDANFTSILGALERQSGTRLSIPHPEPC